MQRDFPQIYDDLLVKRNTNWMPHIKAMFKTVPIEFVLVGALHLAGDHSILKMLAEQGYQIEKLEKKRNITTGLKEISPNG